MLVFFELQLVQCLVSFLPLELKVGDDAVELAVLLLASLRSFLS